MFYKFKQLLILCIFPFLIVPLLIFGAPPSNQTCLFGGCPNDISPTCNSVLANWSFVSETLLFKACEDGLCFGIEKEQVQNGVNENPQKFSDHLLNPHFSWNAGFRIGAGLKFPCTCWDLNFNWMSYSAKAHGTFDENQPSFISFTPVYGQTLGSNLIRVKDHFKMRLNLLDLELGRVIDCNDCLAFRPFAGVRGGWLDQHSSLKYFMHNLLGGADILSQDFRFKTNFAGAGLRGGIDTDWKLGCGFSIYGSAAAAIMYGRYDVESVDALTIAGREKFTREFEQEDHFCGCLPVVDAALGLRWKKWLCCDTVAVTLQVGWEYHHFWNCNRFEDIADPGIIVKVVKNPQVRRGDLCINGLVLSSIIEF